jgi:acyl-CoA synthetase (AMP-forming)/AMP-acid ligase II
MDSSGTRRETGEGELVIKSPSAMSGYLRRPDLTAPPEQRPTPSRFGNGARQGYATKPFQKRWFDEIPRNNRGKINREDVRHRLTKGSQ